MVCRQGSVNRPNISKRTMYKKQEYVAYVSVYRNTQVVPTSDEMGVTSSSHKYGNIVIKGKDFFKNSARQENIQVGCVTARVLTVSDSIPCILGGWGGLPNPSPGCRPPVGRPRGSAQHPLVQTWLETDPTPPHLIQSIDFLTELF